ncbi:MAG: metalloregulator ArsR/SmtB family transcription factor [Thermoleophilia bacterium]
MPLDVAPSPVVTAIGPVVAASAVMELSALICTSCAQACGGPPRGTLSLPDAVVRREQRVWGDGQGMLSELVVLADAVGLVESLDVEPLLERLLSPVMFATDPALESEYEADRILIWQRLRRLARDRRLRVRYVEVLREMWACFADRWEGGERERAQRVAREWAQRLREGAEASSFLVPEHIARRPQYAEMAQRAQRDGTLILSPATASTRGHIVSLPSGRLSVSAGVVETDPIVARREVAGHIADQLRVLAEPTRLTILAQLAQGPSGVSELARTLHIAQPTASVHLRRLRDAGLVEVDRQGGGATYTLRPEAVAALMDDVGGRLTRQLAGAQ